MLRRILALMKAEKPVAGRSLVRAAQYVRASTEHQQYSTENQRVANERYASEHNIEIVQTYADEGKSGLTLQNRKGLRQLLEDVENGNAPFTVILIYDVSRWGRFQDVDESAYYEYRCRRAKVDIHYCAENFTNDGSISSALLKTLKRTMAGEFSRELSAKVFAGKCRLVERGFRQGGRAGYGFRRLLIDQNGNRKKTLKSGERKSIATDRVILVPGPASEVKRVREIYRQFVEEHKSMSAIAEELNRRGVINEYGRPWTRAMVFGILTNPKYIGANVTNRTSFKLQAKSVVNPPEMWVRRERAFQPLVSERIFKRAQEELAAACVRYSNEELLRLLEQLLSKTGNLTGDVIDQASWMPCSRVYQDRFGSLLEAYRRIGYVPPHDYSYREINNAMRVLHEECIAKLVTDFEDMGATVRRGPDTHVITINDELRLRLRTIRCCRSATTEYRWFFRFDGASCDITIAARMAPGNNAVLDYFIVPCFERVPSHFYSGADNSFVDIYRFEDLSVLGSLVRRTHLVERTLKTEKQPSS